jgi:hypothetical protein
LHPREPIYPSREARPNAHTLRGGYLHQGPDAWFEDIAYEVGVAELPRRNDGPGDDQPLVA